MRNAPIHLGILGSTRGTDLQAILDAIERQELNATVNLVISDRPNAYILQRASDHHVPALLLTPTSKTREAFDNEVTHHLERANVDLILLIGYMRILSPNFVRRWDRRIYNVHPSLLPAFAGGMDLNVHQAVLDAKVPETGCTVHIVTAQVDAGPILVQKRCSVDPSDTAETLKAKVQALEGQALVEAIQQTI